MTILFNRGLLLAREETTFREDSIDGDVPAAVANDSFLIQEPVFDPDVQQLQRQNVKTSLSNDPIVTGRKVATVTFIHEVRGNGVSPPVNGTPPRLGNLLTFCAMERTFRDAETTPADALGKLTDVKPGGSTGSFALTGSAGYAGAVPRRARITFTGSAEVDVTLLAEGGLPEETNNAQVFADAGTITLGQSVTADISGYSDDAVAGDVFEVDILPAAHEYSPMSDIATMKSCTIYLYFDGLLHKLTGARGTWSVEGSGADYARFSFTFTGDYIDPVDASIPSDPGYENTQPRPVELAALALQKELLASKIDLCAQQFTLDLANEVNIRECINGAESYEGAVITARTPVGSFNPEAVPEADFPFWNALKEGSRLGFRAKIGTQRGNVVSFRAPSAQISDMGYSERNGVRVYDVSLQLAGVNEDDELTVALS